MSEKRCTVKLLGDSGEPLGPPRRGLGAVPPGASSGPLGIAGSVAVASHMALAHPSGSESGPWEATE